MKYQKYDLSYKQGMVEEFIKENESTGITMTQFSHNRDIPLSTLSKWYRIYKSADLHDPDPSDTVPVLRNKGFIELSTNEPVSVKTVVAESINTDVAPMKLKINGAEIEFPSYSLADVIKVLKDLC